MTPAPDARHAYVADLGTDEVVSYDLAAGSLLTRLGGLHLPPGSGPRHLAFGAAGTLAFLTLELSGSVAALRREPQSGRLDLLGVFPARPADAAGAQARQRCWSAGRSSMSPTGARAARRAA